MEQALRTPPTCRPSGAPRLVGARTGTVRAVFTRTAGPSLAPNGAGRAELSTADTGSTPPAPEQTPSGTLAGAANGGPAAAERVDCPAEATVGEKAAPSLRVRTRAGGSLSCGSGPSFRGVAPARSANGPRASAAGTAARTVTSPREGVTLDQPAFDPAAQGAGFGGRRSGGPSAYAARASTGTAGEVRRSASPAKT